jgi:hypothetical protein
MLRVAVPLAIAAMLGLSVYRVKEGPRWLNRDAPLVETPVPAAAPPMDPNRRVLFIVLDGARTDATSLVPALGAFPKRSTLTAELPTISAAQYVALLSGVPPEDSGRRSNEHITPTGLDSVAAAVHRAGGKTAVFSDCVDWWWRLFPGAFDGHGPVSQPVPLDANFTVVHLCAFDTAGHRSGAASDDYRVRAAASVQRDVSALLAAWNDAGPVIVTADHGHRDAGGHGGDEPEVRTTFALFRGVDATPAATGRAVDLAPTLSALLGVPAPVSSQGTSLLGTEPRPEVKRLAPDGSLLVERGLRALLVLVCGALLLRFSARRGFMVGTVALVAVCAVYLLRYPLSISGHRDYAMLVMDTALVAVGCTLLLAALPLWRLARTRGRSSGLEGLLGAAGATGLIAVASNVVYGVASPRLTIDSSVALAVPSIANAAWAGSLFPLLLCAIAVSFTSDRPASGTSSRAG